MCGESVSLSPHLTRRLQHEILVDFRHWPHRGKRIGICRRMERFRLAMVAYGYSAICDGRHRSWRIGELVVKRFLKDDLPLGIAYFLVIASGLVLIAALAAEWPGVLG